MWTSFPSPEAGAAALRECPCGSGRSGRHLLVFADSHGETHVVGTPRPDPPPLAVELAQLYPRAPLVDIDHWPCPPELNEPLGPPPSASPIPERQEHAALLRGKHGLSYAPEMALISTSADETPPPGVAVPPPQSQAVVEGYGPPLPPERTCTAPGCSAKHYALGLCVKHHARFKRNSTLDQTDPTAEQRFLSKVHKTDSCWLWTAPRQRLRRVLG